MSQFHQHFYEQLFVCKCCVKQRFSTGSWQFLNGPILNNWINRHWPENKDYFFNLLSDGSFWVEKHWCKVVLYLQFVFVLFLANGGRQKSCLQYVGEIDYRRRKGSRQCHDNITKCHIRKAECFQMCHVTFFEFFKSYFIVFEVSIYEQKNGATNIVRSIFLRYLNLKPNFCVAIYLSRAIWD